MIDHGSSRDTGGLHDTRLLDMDLDHQIEAYRDALDVGPASPGLLVLVAGRPPSRFDVVTQLQECAVDAGWLTVRAAGREGVADYVADQITSGAGVTAEGSWRERIEAVLEEQECLAVLVDGVGAPDEVAQIAHDVYHFTSQGWSVSLVISADSPGFGRLRRATDSSSCLVQARSIVMDGKRDPAPPLPVARSDGQMEPGSAQGLPAATTRTWDIIATEETRDESWHIQYRVAEPGCVTESFDAKSLGEAIGRLAGTLTDELNADVGCRGYHLNWSWTQWDPYDPQPTPTWFRGRAPRVPLTIGSP